MDLLKTIVLKNNSLKQAVKNITEKYNLKRNDVYEKALEIKNNAK